jgi:tetratricopeptide (TPR) repeat protein
MQLAVLFLPFALLQAGQAPLLGGDPHRLESCVALIESDAPRAYEEGMAWAAETHEVGGYRCAAMALAAQGRNDEAARRFESLAGIIGPETTGVRAELFVQAGNAWLLAHDASRARSAFTRAIAVMQGDTEVMPDLLIDRARAYALEGDYRHAEQDLTQALDLRANDALALRLRAAARMHQNAFELAEADARAAVALEPTNVDALLMLGHAREARRTGQPVLEQ